MAQPALIFLLAFCCLLAGCETQQERCTETRNGCKVEDGRCVCGNGCSTEYRYRTKTECHKAIRRTQDDICQRNPCLHGGKCSQTTQDPGFKCRCEGTGYYKQRCQKECPKLTTRITGEFPYECILI